MDRKVRNYQIYLGPVMIRKRIFLYITTFQKKNDEEMEHFNTVGEFLLCKVSNTYLSSKPKLTFSVCILYASF